MLSWPQDADFSLCSLSFSQGKMGKGKMERNSGSSTGARVQPWDQAKGESTSGCALHGSPHVFN